MPSAEVLDKRRDRARDREERTDKLIVADELDLKRLLEEIADEREERGEFEARRKELVEALEEEIRADERGKGRQAEHWEDWIESRRDELADLIDASESRLDRLVKRAAREENGLKDLRKRDSKLEARIDRITRQLAQQATQRAGQMTKDFHIAEFNCKDGTPVPSYMAPHLKAMCERHLQPLRSSGGTVSINSGYRHAAYNARIGGASQSYHVYELRKRSPAVDHIQGGRSASAVQAWHESHTPFDGMGFYSGFTHGDDRGYRSRWYGVA